MTTHTATLDNLISDLRKVTDDNGPQIPFQLHDGLRAIIDAFGEANLAADFLERYRVQRIRLEF